MLNGCSLNLVEMNIGRNQVRASYNRADYFQERKEMMQAWADFILPR
jgi:hypothetical protein